MNKRNLTILLAVLFVAGLVAYFAFGGKAEPAPTEEKQNVSLEVSASQEVYKAGDEVKLSMSLKNEGTSEVCLSEGALGNIKLVSVKRDGQDVETRGSESDFLLPFVDLLKIRLTPVAPGADMTFDLVSEFDPGMNKQALSQTVPDNTFGVVTYYNVEEVGEYEVKLVYEYTAGASEECASILKDKTNEVTVNFKVE